MQLEQREINRDDNSSLDRKRGMLRCYGFFLLAHGKLGFEESDAFCQGPILPFLICQSYSIPKRERR